MLINQYIEQKMTPSLCVAMKQASDADLLKVIATTHQRDKSESEPALLLSDFPSRKAWRSEMIKRRRRLVSSELESLSRELRDLGLKVYAGTISRVVVLEGEPSKLLSALSLEQIKDASLDLPITIGP